jgi:hypothetical protein
MMHSLNHFLHPFNLLWRERNQLFWFIWIATTVVSILLVLWAVPAKNEDSRNSTSHSSLNWSRGAILAISFLALFLACYIAGSLVWEDFTYYDNSHFTDGTLVGKNIPLQIVPENGRFFPLGHQEFNLIRHFTTSIIGYHALRITQLVLLCALLMVFDKDLSIQARVALILLVLITPSILVSFSGLIYPEWNVVFWLLCLAWSVQRFEQTQFRRWAVAAVACSQFMLYYKETAFLLLLGFAVGRLLIRSWKTDRPGWDFHRLRDPESRLDICLTLLGLWFFAYYLVAMFPHYNTDYAEEFQLSFPQVVASYLWLDLLVWVLMLAVFARIVQILRRQAVPVLLWDGLGLAGVGCFAGYLILRMNSAYFLAPADIIAVLYLGHFALASPHSLTRARKVCTAALLLVVLLQDVSLSAFRMYERKNVIHAKEQMGQAIKARYAADPRSVTRLFFPFADPFPVLEFVSYLNYIGVPIEGARSGRDAVGSVTVTGKAFQSVGPCGYRTFICHPGTRPEAGDLVLVLPDDFKRTAELNSYQSTASEPVFFYRSYPPIPPFFFPYVKFLRIASPVLSQTQLPDAWLDASVIAWK